MNKKVVPFTSEHYNGRFRKSELINQEIPHALSIVNASFKLVTGETIRHADNNRLLTAMGIGWRTRRGVIIRRRHRRRRRRRRRVKLRIGRWRRRRGSAWISNVCNRLTNSTAD